MNLFKGFQVKSLFLGFSVARCLIQDSYACAEITAFTGSLGARATVISFLLLL